jgi:hypothetical protein
MKRMIALVAATSLLIGTEAGAQQAPQAYQPPQLSALGAQQQPVAQQCFNDINAFGERMNKDGFWLNGYGGRWGYAAAPAAASPWGAIIGSGLNALAHASGPVWLAIGPSLALAAKPCQ